MEHYLFTNLEEMPKTRSTATKQVKVAGAVAKAATASKAKKVKDTSEAEPTATCSNEPTAYEKLLAKVNAKRKAETAKDKRVNTPVKKARLLSQEDGTEENEQQAIHASFVEDGQIMDMSVTVDEQRREFPLPSDDEDSEIEFDLEESSKNNNATVSRPQGATGSLYVQNV